MIKVVQWGITQYYLVDNQINPILQTILQGVKMSKQLPDELYANNFMTYAKGISSLKADDCKAIDDGDLTIIMRVFYWYVQASGFQDIYDLSLAVLKLLKKCEESGKIDKNNYDFKTVMRFNWEFVKNGNYFGSASNMVYSLKNLKDIIKANVTAEEFQSVEQYHAIFNTMQGTEHECYYLLREIIRPDHLDSLFNLVKTLAPEHQDWILHALDSFKGNKKVIAFYVELLTNTTSDWLKEEIETYLSRVKG